MSIEEQLFAVLSGIAAIGPRVYPNVAPDQPTTPYIVYHNIANSPEVTLADGVPINNTRMQIDIYDTSYLNGVKARAADVVAAMVAAAFTNVPLMNQDLWEQDVKLHRVQMDYSIWS